MGTDTAMGEHYVGAQDDLSAYFVKSATVVRHVSERVEEVYLRPGIEFAHASFTAHPIAAVFVATFTTLSFLPIATFIVFSLFAVASVVFLAICVAFTVSAFAISLFVAILLVVLTTTFFISVFLTTSGLALYLSSRLFVHLRSSGLQGFYTWAGEARKTLFQSQPSQVAEDSDSEDSAVVIKKETITEESHHSDFVTATPADAREDQAEF
ncbi:hypothetical protein EW146_g7499 [Bondarzewia mesenterica]|uniref:Uncharacterized protein n=1 Tax=Bondarzewia mesenterica TaxID=1095465 RepID=A0A4S4LRA0_9AGAM|nr:hypothetical protein EW146_g7499 [Bondarzewia mesenterica]